MEERLLLLDWLHQRLGYTDTGPLLKDMKLADEGFDPDGHSYVYNRLASREGRLQGITLDDLQRYDHNIRAHLAAMNAGRRQPITLRYFQYLAALYAEIFLDWYFNHSKLLLESLNRFVSRRNARRRTGEHVETNFNDYDLKKLAFWMATGSGKTLLMHLNYRQFLHYNPKALDNILLITPNEGLSEQHLAELQASNIPADRFDVAESGLLAVSGNRVKVTEITKLVEQKRGGGVRVPVEAFEGNNLIFVDEGHKGSGGEAWRRMRDMLGETGFTFEYSATFGQALSAAGNEDLAAEYGKAIAFDYSYRFFYDEGYGKDFHILNLQQETTQDQTDRLLLANLLSFYEQQMVFEQQRDALRRYNLDQPLWVFVGSKVNAVHRERGRSRSDVLTVVRFLHRLLSDVGWATTAISQLLKGQSELRDQYGEDVFNDKFDYLRQRMGKAENVYRGILEKTLHAPAGGGLHISDIRGSRGELGLKVGGADDYFGLIYIGDTAAFKNLVKDDNPDVAVEDDAVSGPLFSGVNQPGSSIEILIGARKFIEGWNSWRVSNIGLLNIGRSEGSQIIQLFGRGVRLRGLNFTLKRSSALEGRHPDHLDLLETLNIFAVRANYMAQFRDYLEREGVATDRMLELPLLIQPNRDFLGQGLLIPRLDEKRNFKAEAEALLESGTQVHKIFVDMTARVQSVDIGRSGIEQVSASSGSERRIPSESLDLVDWDKVYLALIEHKEQKGLENLALSKKALRSILEADPPVYRLKADDALVNPTGFAEWERLQEGVVNILRKYADAFYRSRRERWESQRLVYKTFDDRDSNLRFNVSEEKYSGRYIVSVPRKKTALIAEIEQLIADCDKLYNGEQGKLPRIHFDRHVYQPLLLEGEGIAKISPPGLTDSERNFIDGLKTYWAKEQGRAPDGPEVFLLRNQSRGMGVGFFENRGFYPDFILWIKTGDNQRIVFVEPHGMIHSNAYAYDHKARLHEKLPELAEKISHSSGPSNVSLDSFIVSATPYEELHKRYDDGKWSREQFADKHVLFPERNDGYDYVAEIFRETENPAAL